jgi:hypothetical protein
MKCSPIIKTLCVMTLLCLTNFSNAQVASEVYPETSKQASFSRFSYKDYETGKRIAYIQLSGTFTTDDFLLIQKYLRSLEGVLRASIFDIAIEKRDHLVFIESNGSFVTQKWLEFTLTNFIKTLK